MAKRLPKPPKPPRPTRPPAVRQVYEFFEIDTDHNGVINVQEVLAFEAKLRTASK